MGRVGSRVHIGRVVSGVCRSAKRLPHTQVLFQQRDVEKNRRRIIMYYARPPGHQPPSRRGARIPARPETGTSVAPGFHTHLLTPVTRNPHPPDRPQFRMASMRPGAGGCVRRRVCLQTPPAPGDACLPYIMNLWGRHVWLQEHGSAGGGNPGATDVAVAWWPGCPGARAGWRLMFGGSC